MTDSEKIKIVRKRLGYTQEVFAKALGIEQGTYSDYERGRTGVPRKVVELLFYKFNVSKDWWQSQEGEVIVITIKPPESNDKGIPILNQDFTAGEVTQFKDFPETIVGYIYFATFKNCIAFVSIKGNSMFPLYTAGDLIGLEPQTDLSHIDYGHPYGIVTKGGNRFVKIIRKGKDNNHLVLRSYNSKDYDDIDIHKNDIQTLYKAHGPIRDHHY